MKLPKPRMKQNTQHSSSSIHVLPYFPRKLTLLHANTPINNLSSAQMSGSPEYQSLAPLPTTTNAYANRSKLQINTAKWDGAYNTSLHLIYIYCHKWNLSEFSASSWNSGPICLDELLCSEWKWITSFNHKNINNSKDWLSPFTTQNRKALSKNFKTRDQSFTSLFASVIGFRCGSHTSTEWSDTTFPWTDTPEGLVEVEIE